MVAGLYGYVSAVKWIEEINLTTWDAFDGYWVPRGWSKRGPMKTQSRIDVPGNGDRPVAGTSDRHCRHRLGADSRHQRSRGAHRRRTRGSNASWARHWVTRAGCSGTWPWTPTAGTHSLQVRAIDGTGMTQPEGPKDVRPDGAEGWHRIAVRVDAA